MIELDKIYNEDCLEGMKRIADGAVDCIITDLPYGTTACAWDSVIPFEPLWEQFRRVCKTGAPIVLFSSGLFTVRLILSNEKTFRYRLIWKKNVPTGMCSANNRPMKYYEEICVFGVADSTYNPQMKERVGVSGVTVTNISTTVAIAITSSSTRSVKRMTPKRYSRRMSWSLMWCQTATVNFTLPRSPLTSCATLS